MRRARNNIPTVTYHVISRFVDRSWQFQDDVERAFYLARFGAVIAETDWRCLAFALMSSHIHLAMLAGRDALESWAKRVNSTVAGWLNQRHGRLGPVFAERPDDRAIPTNRLRHVIAYIHNNPVRAGVVSAAADSSWTSHRMYIGTAPRPAWLHVDETLSRLGLDATSFDGWVNSSVTEVDGVSIDVIRRELRRRGELNIATPTLGDGITVPVVARPFATVRPDPRLVLRVVADITGITELEITSRRRNASVVAARRLAVHCGDALGLCGSDLASVLGVSRQGVSKLLRRGMTGRDQELRRVVLDRIVVEMT